MPPLAVPPLSCSRTVTVAMPLALGAAVKVSAAVVPAKFTTWGGTANSEGLLVSKMKLGVWVLSFAAAVAGPTEMLVAQLLMVIAPASSVTVGPVARVRLGAS